jgi:ABC-2 type transport system permease protein
VPIYDQSYRPYRGAFSSHSTRWWTIARTGVLSLLSRRLFIVLLCVTFIFPVVSGFQIYFSTQFPEENFRGLLAVNAEFWRRLLEIQSFWMIVLGFFPGAGLISKDLKGNAIQLYLSKPLTRVDYVVGKLAILATFMLGVTLIPGLLLFTLKISFSSDLTFLREYWWIPFSVIGYSAIAVVAWGLIVLALSSTSKSAGYVGLLMIAIVFISSGFALFLRGILGSEGVMVLSPADDLKQITYMFFGGTSEFGDLRVPALVVLALLTAASVLILRARVRAVEVVT